MKRELAFFIPASLLLTVLLTWPLGVDLAQPPLGGDPSQNAWNLWWVEKAVTESEADLLYTRHLWYPDGANLALHSLSQLNGFLGLPGVWALGVLPTLRLLLLLTFPLSALGMYLLARRYVDHWAPAALAAFVFAFCPFRMTRFNLEQIDILSTHWMPFYVLCLLLWLEDRSWKGALGAALFAVLTALSAWYHAGALVLLTLFVLAYSALRGRIDWRDRRFLAGGAVLVLLPVIVLAPFLAPMAQEAAKPGAEHGDQIQESVENSADLLAYFVPDGFWPSTLVRMDHAYFGWSLGTAREVYGTFDLVRNEVTAFPGYAVWIVIIMALFLRTERMRFGLWGALVFGVLTLGPMLQVAGQKILPMPYVIINYLPGLAIMRAPSRLNILFLLFAALVLALVLERCRLSGRRRLMVLFALLLALEYPAVPLQRQHTPPPIPPGLTLVEDGPGEAVLNVPEALSPNSAYVTALYQFHQTRHGKAILGGYTSRVDFSRAGPFLEDRPALAALEWNRIMGPSPDARVQSYAVGEYRVEPGELDSLADELRELGIRQVLVHRPFFAANPATWVHLRYHLAQSLEEPVHEDSLLAIFMVPEVNPS